MKHIILAGDSIFDNKPYINESDLPVIEQVRGELGQICKCTLLALDGDTTDNVVGQLQQLPQDATHLFISVGGNDALGVLQSLIEPVTSIGEAFFQFHDIRKEFKKKYFDMLSNALSYGLPTTICTVYHPCFTHNELGRVSDYLGHGIDNQTMQKVTITALSIFNDIIFEHSIKSGIPIIDLRIIFDNDADYANPIEPSATGGLKIAKVINHIAQNHDFSLSKTIVYI